VKQSVTVLQRLEPALLEFVKQQHVPGLSVAVTTRERTLFSYSCGFANHEARVLTDVNTLYQIGSISKMFTALAVLQEVEKGSLDLHAPVTNYLPWFGFRNTLGDITVHHLLTHTAGLPEGSDGAPDSLYSVYVLNELDAVWKPGERFYYSNIGYKALGFVLEKVTGKSYADIIQEQILTPLEMRQSAPTITTALYPRLATGYVPLYDDRPFYPSQPLRPATWLENIQGDGSIASTANDLLCFARAMLNRGVVGTKKLLSEGMFGAFTASHIADDGGEPFTAYGYGTMLMNVNDVPCFGHTGAMVGFQSAFLIDSSNGYGIILLVNSLGQLDTIDVVSAIHKVLLEPKHGAVDFSTLQAKQVSLETYAGVYKNETETLEFVFAEGELRLCSASLDTLLEPYEDDTFIALHPRFEKSVFHFERNEQGSVTNVVHGNDIWFNEKYQGEKESTSPETWNAYPGYYRSYSPWLPSLRVTLVKGELRLEGDVLVLQVDGSFRPQSAQPNVLSFHDVVEGNAQRLRLSGSDFYRVGKP
jgi:D-alanyl-D-alanine carboxypeptidase